MSIESKIHNLKKNIEDIELKQEILEQQKQTYLLHLKRLENREVSADQEPKVQD